MNPETIQTLLRVRAMEEADPNGETLSFSHRDHATLEALTEVGDPGLASENKKITRQQWKFLARRAEILQQEKNGNVSFFSPANTKRMAIGICLVAFVLGATSHILGLSRSFDIVALPILVLLLWNAVVYALIIYGWIRPAKATREHGMMGFWLKRLLPSSKGLPDADKASQFYLTSLVPWIRSWLTPSVVSWFHAGSACFVLGLLAAIYLRGLGKEYVAEWESTWFSASGVKTLIGGILSPASWISGISLPATLEEWDHLHRSHGRGVNAGSWIHLYALTLIGGIVLPRMLLAGVSALKAKRALTSPPEWNAGEPYVARLLNQSRPSEHSRIAILPFDLKNIQMLTDDYHKTMERLVRETWGQNATACWLECVPYGDEEEVFANKWQDAKTCDGALLLLDMSATPEREVHGALIDSVAKQFAHSSQGLLIVLESKGMNPAKLPTRLDLWKKILHQRNMRPLLIHEGTATETANFSSFIHQPK